MKTRSNRCDYEKLIAILAPEKGYVGRGFPEDTYHYLVTLSWSAFLFFTVLFIVLCTIIFGLFYYLTDSIKLNYAGVNSTNIITIWDAFFFSMTSITTIGYGDIRAVGVGRLAAGIEATIGLMFIGVFTALAFSRFSRARIRIHFSKHIVFDEHEGLPALMFRVTNLRTNDLVGVHIDFYFMKVIHLKRWNIHKAMVYFRINPTGYASFFFYVESCTSDKKG